VKISEERVPTASIFKERTGTVLYAHDELRTIYIWDVRRATDSRITFTEM
jgi:hypothetical protein